MKRVLMVAGLVAFTGAALSAQGAPAVDPAVMAAQAKFHEAQKTCNAAGIAGMVTDDMLFLHADGRVEDKAAFTKFVSMCALEDIRLDVKTARTYGDVAVLTGSLPFKVKQGPSMTFMATQVYVRRNGAWLLASHQSTHAESFAAAMAKK
jgi:uncharacterized protein (TIGR02246 family)